MKSAGITHPSIPHQQLWARKNIRPKYITEIHITDCPSPTSMNLLQILRQISTSRSSIKLLNIYKGLPISYDTNIVSTGISEIQVTGSKSQIACLYYQGESYLQGTELPFVIHSTVKSLNLAQDYAVLTNFEVAQNNIGMREQIRVEPDDPLVVSIQFKGSAYDFPVLLADISVNGASVFFESYMFPNRLSLPGNVLTMTISIPDFVARKMKKLPVRPANDGRNEGRKMTAPLHANPSGRQDGQIIITASGKVVAVRPEIETNRYRLSAQLFFKDLSRMVILQYISHRQSEIIKDLRILSEDLYNRKNNIR